MNFSNSPLRPRDGYCLWVLIIARISGCQGQKETSLEAQIEHVKEIVQLLWDGPVEFVVISTTSKGELLERPELAEVEAALRSGKFDLAMYEDLGRLVRGAEAAWLMGIGKDKGTRSISINENLDTDDPMWEKAALSACSEHVAHNTHTSLRIKHKKFLAFLKSGAISGLPIVGYVVPDNSKTYSDWSKDVALSPVITEAVQRLWKDQNCTAVAEWLNKIGFPTGPYSRRKKWDGKMVRRVFCNPILKGLPIRGKMHTIKIYETGARKSVHNSVAPKYFSAPHLAHVDPILFDEMAERLEKKNKKLGRKGGAGGSDPLTGVSRKRSRFPGRCATCWYCGREYVWGGNGQKGSLMCKGAREHQCWCSVAFRSDLAVTAIISYLKQEVLRLPAFDEQYRQLITQASVKVQAGDAATALQIDVDERELARQKANIMASIKETGPHPMLKEELNAISNAELELKKTKDKLAAMRQKAPVVPESISEFQKMFQETFNSLMTDSYKFADVLRNMIDMFSVYLVQLCDGGHLMPRAKIVLAMDRLVPDMARVPGMSELLQREVTIDLLDPPQRERIRTQVVKHRGNGSTERQIVELIPEGPTITAVQRAMVLHRKMIELGLATPYILINEPPEGYTKLRRHKHEGYRFEPLEGYVPPPID